MKKLQVVLVDDEIMIREGFKRLFDWSAHDCEVVGEAADGNSGERLSNKREYRIATSVPDAKTQSRTCENQAALRLLL